MDVIFCFVIAGNAAVIKYEEKAPKQAFQNGSGALYLKPLVPRAHAHLLKTPPKGIVFMVMKRKLKNFKLCGFKGIKF